MFSHKVVIVEQKQLSCYSRFEVKNHEIENPVPRENRHKIDYKSWSHKSIELAIDTDPCSGKQDEGSRIDKKDEELEHKSKTDASIDK
ncbi:Hypothetical predicted protein [Octopus vulgaris]|uniref:Uncharacterized protein n=1 Tax=Octopus vulgaris TaxID=6645 RepID=A0AA36B9F9_OCTVU|nr:Hypothetical predicted protein [Octopus vulgaris]